MLGARSVARCYDHWWVVLTNMSASLPRAILWLWWCRSVQAGHDHRGAGVGAHRPEAQVKLLKLNARQSHAAAKDALRELLPPLRDDDDPGMLLAVATAGVSQALRNFALVAARAKGNETSWPFLAVANFDWAVHAECRALRHCLRSNLSMVCVPPPMALALGRMNRTGDDVGAIAAFGSRAFRALQLAKLSVLQAVLAAAERDVLLLDLDALIVRNAIPFFRSMVYHMGQPGTRIKLVVQNGGGGGIYNTGIVFAIHVAGTDALLSKWYDKTVRTNTSTPEQSALLSFSQIPNISAQILPIHVSVLWHRWRCLRAKSFLRTHDDRLTTPDFSAAIPTGPLIIHYSGLYSMQAKMRCMKAEENWLVSSDWCHDAPTNSSDRSNHMPDEEEENATSLGALLAGAHTRGGVVFTTVTLRQGDEANLGLLLNWYTRLQQLKSHPLVIGIDEGGETCRIARQHGIRCHAHSAADLRDTPLPLIHARDGVRPAAVDMKHAYAATFLRHGLRVSFSDADVYWVRAPLLGGPAPDDMRADDMRALSDDISADDAPDLWQSKQCGNPKYPFPYGTRPSVRSRNSDPSAGLHGPLPLRRFALHEHRRVGDAPHRRVQAVP